MTDITIRLLRRAVSWMDQSPDTAKDLSDAAGEIDRLTACLSNTTRERDEGTEMLRKMANGWQSNMTSTEGYDSLVWDARALLDRLAGLEAP